MPNERISPQEAAQSLYAELHPDCNFLLLAGSFVRGEATASSDLDIVVLYNDLPFAYRESILWRDYPVEIFVHSPQTLRYFFEKVDGPSGIPSLMQMVCEGIEIPQATPLSLAMKGIARQVIDAGPLPLTEEEVKARRYQITGLVDDVRTPRSREELIATGTQLYEELADFYFRSQNLWSAGGKTVPRKLQKHAPEFAARFQRAFEALFGANDPTLVVVLAEDVLTQGSGSGFLFAGYRLDAPADFKL